MEKKIVVENGVKYQVINCAKCGAELKFKMHKEARRVYGACAKCLTNFEVLIDHE